jgi:peptidoglycan/LPS O-acetylase OafA/YrhL
MDDAKRHLHGFDWLRAIGIFAVVWIHGCDTHPAALRWSRFAGFAVPDFILISFFLLQRSLCTGESRPWTVLLVRRLGRLLPAYLVWSIAYLAVRAWKHSTLTPGASDPSWGVALLTGGASYQMYFIAALLYWSIPFVPLMAWLARQSVDSRRIAALSLGLVGMGLWGGGTWLAHHQTFSGPFLLRQMTVLSGYVPLGIALALWSALPAPASSAPKPRGLHLAAGGAALAWLAGGPSWALPLISALGFFVWALSPAVGAPPAMVRRVARVSFGIFLVHGFFIEGFQLFAPKLGLAPGSLAVTLGVILGAFTASWGLCEALGRWRRTRWLVL